MMFSRRRKGWPPGWSQPSKLYNKFTKQWEVMPIVWIKGRRAGAKDIEALFGYYGHPIAYDELSTVGKNSMAYTTKKRERQKELGYNIFWRWLD